MNLEQLLKLIKTNYHKIKDKKFAINLLKYHYELLQWKKQKLKLGALVFEIKETVFYGIVILEEIDIRYTRQDNTATDALKLENRLKTVGWNWDVRNIVALLLVLFLFLCQTYSYFYNWYCKYLPTLAFRAEHFDYILRFGFENTLAPNIIGDLKKWSATNYWLVDLFTDFCTYFDIIF